MDLLFKRYADPFSLLNGYIQIFRFHWFVPEFCRQVCEDNRWEFFLHKVWDQTYPDFCASLEANKPPVSMSDEDLKATVADSLRILGSFNPEEGEP